jgi:uncharacterized coiled-coil protein SlyX
MRRNVRAVILCAGAGILALMSAREVEATPIDSNSGGNETTIQELKAMIASQQKEIEDLRKTLGKQQQTLDKLAASPNSTATLLPAPQAAAAGPGAEHKSPLGFQIGDATFTPVGFMDFTAVWRSADQGGGIGTGFSGTPYNNAPLGRLPETHFSAQNSRVGMRVDSTYHDMKIRGYLETDFLGNAAGSLAVTSNANTMRMRLYWVDLTKGNIEFLAGQSWSMMTPNRKGISPMPSDIFYSQDMDTNYQNGLIWTRAAQIRLIYHGGDRFAWGLAMENPEQYIGGGVVLPAGLPASFAPEFNAGANTLATPNYTPDFQSKMAFDGKHAHLEIAGLLRTFHDFVPGTPGKTNTAIGVGGEINSNFEIAPGFRLIENAYWSDGGGRYIGNTGAPDVIVRPDGGISPVHSASTVDGLEWTLSGHKNTLLYAYYGGAYIGRNLAVDSAGKVSGYGVSGNGSANRTVQEGTFGWVQTFWKNERYGDMKLITQYSYLWRYPWLVPVTAPKDAHSNMVWINVRYDLP